MSRKNGRIYYEVERNNTIFASRTDRKGVKHCGRGSNRSEATATLRLAEKSKIIAQPQPATAA